jgi:putative membrane protein
MLARWAGDEQKTKTRRTMKIMTLAGCVLALAMPLAWGQQSQTASTTDQTSTESQRGQFSSKDFKFLENAVRGGMEEVELGQLAQQKASNQGVRDFGQRMVTDHNKANDELRALATQKGATLATQTSHSELSTMSHLQNESGANFDQAYVKDMVKDHKKDVKEFEKAAKDLTDPDLKAWAQKTLPILQQHLQLAENLEATVKGQK